MDQKAVSETAVRLGPGQLKQDPAVTTGEGMFRDCSKHTWRCASRMRLRDKAHGGSAGLLIEIIGHSVFGVCGWAEAAGCEGGTRRIGLMS
jgi:hypothetical protein